MPWHVFTALLYVLTKQGFMTKQITCFASCLFFPNHSINHILQSLTTFHNTNAHFLNYQFSHLKFVSILLTYKCPNHYNGFNALYLNLHFNYLNFNVLSYCQNHCMAMPIYYLSHCMML
jgi:hypothetical protein